MTEQDVFTRGELMSCSTGHPVPRAKTVPPSRGFIPQRHSTLRSLPVLCTRHRYLSWGNAQVAPPGKTCSTTCHMSCSIDSTLTTHPRCTPRSPQVHYQVIGTLCLIRPHHSSTKHHITDIMRSKSKTVSSLRASMDCRHGPQWTLSTLSSCLSAHDGPSPPHVIPYPSPSPPLLPQWCFC
jgi:hypothetical protein